MATVKCTECGAYAPQWLGEKYPGGMCAVHDESHKSGMCQDMKLTLMQRALWRALVPDAFDERGRIKPGMIVRCQEAETNALRSANALSGPVLV